MPSLSLQFGLTAQANESVKRCYGMSRSMVAIAVGVAMVLGNAAGAQSVESKLTVTANVLKHASLKVLAQPTSVVITAADIARGYVDVAAPAQVSIQSNSREGYMLMFASESEFLHQTLVRGLGNDVQLSAGGGGVARSADGRGMARITLDLGFRFLLSASARQGVHAWPLRMTVASL